MKNRVRESLISILREKNRDSHFSENRAALHHSLVFICFVFCQWRKGLVGERVRSVDETSAAVGALVHCRHGNLPQSSRV